VSETGSKDMPIHYLIGDGTQPVGTGNKIIAHVCNDVGKWGKGFVLAVSKRWRQPETEFRESKICLALGMVQLVRVEKSIWVANMVAQHGIRRQAGVPPSTIGRLATDSRWASSKGARTGRRFQRPAPHRLHWLSVQWVRWPVAWVFIARKFPSVQQSSGFGANDFALDPPNQEQPAQ
jgi:hypothetical protein